MLVKDNLGPIFFFLGGGGGYFPSILWFLCHLEAQILPLENSDEEKNGRDGERESEGN